MAPNRMRSRPQQLLLQGSGPLDITYYQRHAVFTGYSNGDATSMACRRRPLQLRETSTHIKCRMPALLKPHMQGSLAFGFLNTMIKHNDRNPPESSDIKSPKYS